MRIVRERPCQRLHHRITAPLWVQWDGATVRAADWSLGGLRLSDVAVDAIAPGDRRTVSLSLPFQGFDVGFAAEIEVVRISADGTAALRFVSLGDRERNLMSHFVDELVRGSMVEIDDTIQRIDVPVTPVSTKPDPNPAAEIPLRRLPLKAIVMTTVYLALGLGIIGYVALVLYANFVKLEVETAVVAAPLDVIAAQGDGQLHRMPVAEGETVAQGAVLATVIDNDLEARIDMARIAVDRATAAHDHALAVLAAAEARTADRQAIVHLNLARAEADIRALETLETAADAALSRQEALFADGWATAEALDEARATLADAEAALASRRLDRNEILTLASGSNTGQIFDHMRMLAELDDAHADVDRTRREVRLAEAERDALIDHRDRLAARAPFDGRVHSVVRQPGASLLRGDPLVIVERSGDRFVDAFLNQEEVNQVGLHDPAVVYIPSLDRQLDAQVGRIDRTSGFVDEQQSQYVWRGPDDRSARVALTFAAELDPALVPAPGTPVIVIFDRRSDEGLMASIATAMAGWLENGP